MTTNPDLSEFTALAELEELRRLTSELQKQLRDAKAKTADLVAAVHAGARDAAVILGNPPAVKPPQHDKRTKGDEWGLLHLTDWQGGKKTYSYSTEVMATRVRQLGEKLALLTEIERADHPVRKLAILVGGDMCENVDTFPGQAWEVDSTLFEQIFAVRAELRALIRVALGIYEAVEVWVEPGNHGRLGKVGQYPAADNADRIIYRIVQDDFAEEPRVTWHERNHWYNHVRIGNYTALLVHGDEIGNFQGQTPLFAIKKKVDSWASGVLRFEGEREDFLDCYIGHFHMPFVLPLANGEGRVFGGPSTESDNDYAGRVVAARGTPGQRLNFVDPERGRVTTERVVWLDR